MELGITLSLSPLMHINLVEREPTILEECIMYFWHLYFWKDFVANFDLYLTLNIPIDSALKHSMKDNNGVFYHTFTHTK